MAEPETQLHNEPLWYKDAIIYQLHVKSFFDANDDGIGDLPGLIQRLDYLESLGVTAIWVLPFYPSPLRDDGYDIADYFSINRDYGTLRDFRRLLKEAHRRGIRVITELVLNHTSDQHPWFQKSRRAKAGSRWRDFYVWNDSPDKYPEARIIFQDFNASNWSWDPVAKAYYWHRFYAHQPDLNYDNPRIQKEMMRVVDFWLGMGVDGLRLDAIPYLYEREGTNCENLPETHAFLKRLRAWVDKNFAHRLLLGEANQWPEDAAAYFGDADECHTAFHFPVMPRLFMALRMEDRFPIVDIFDQTPAIPDACQWVMFLRNHDELTLEMVTDEERDYMHRVYAQDPRATINLGIRRRLAPLLDNDRRKIEVMNVLLLSLAGTPVIYYGDELGMGDNYYLGDRDGVRTPMQWSSDRNAGFSRANPQQLNLPVIFDPEYHYETLNVEIQERNVSSLLWWMRHAIATRKRFNAFGRGALEFVPSDNGKVLTFLRLYEDEVILVVANLSRYAQVVELNLSDHAGSTPVEVFSHNRFPRISEATYVLTLGPYGYYWLHLEREREALIVASEEEVPEVETRKNWQSVFEASHEFVRRVLPRYLPTCRWFGGKGRAIRKVRIAEVVPLRRLPVARSSCVTIVDVTYEDDDTESYLLPLTYAAGEQAGQIMQESPQSVIARVRTSGEAGILYDGVYDPAFRAMMFSMIGRKRRVKGKSGQLAGGFGKEFKRFRAKEDLGEDSRVLRGEQSNSSIVYGEECVLKLYRKVERGVNPEPEIVCYLTEQKGFANIPAFMGALELQRRGSDPIAVGLLQEFVPNQGDAWTYLVDEITRYYERVLAGAGELDGPPALPASLLDMDLQSVPPVLSEEMGALGFEMIALLGRRTAEMHEALASATDNRSFAPERFSLLYQRSLYQSIRGQVRRTLLALKKRLKQLPENVRDQVAAIVDAETELSKGLQKIRQRKIEGTKIRIHGDYHLGQVLYTGKDFVIIDFEGEPARPLSERRLKRSAMRDVAGMVRSFHYAAYGPLLLPSPIRPEDAEVLEPWGNFWYAYASGIFLNAYREAVGGTHFVPEDRGAFETLLEVFLLEKAVYELHYEMNNRPDWLVIPVKGMNVLLDKSGEI